MAAITTDCLAVVPHLAATILDVGGAGLPGIPLALVGAGGVTLLDSNHKSGVSVSHDELGLSNTEGV